MNNTVNNLKTKSSFLYTNVLNRPYKANEPFLFKLYCNLLSKIERYNYFLYFNDYNDKLITFQLKQIYNNIKEDYESHQSSKELVKFYFHKNLLNFENNYYQNNNKSFFSGYFKNETYNWEIVRCSSIHGYNFASPIEHSFAQITAKYKEKISEDKIIDRYMVFQRCLIENISFHSWKVFVIDYKI